MTELTVVVTRPLERRAEFTKLLESSGFRTFVLPVLELHALPIGPEVDPLLTESSKGTFAWLIFTSANGIRFFHQRMRELGLSLPPRQTRVAVQGEGSRKVAELLFRRPADFVSQGSRAEDFLTELIPRVLPTDRVLVPSARDGREVVGDGLREHGVQAVSFALYETTIVPPTAEQLQSFLALPTDSTLVTFYSPSAVSATLAVGEDVREFLTRVPIATIGPVTSERVRASGLTVSFESPRATDEALVHGLRKYRAVA